MYTKIKNLIQIIIDTIDNNQLFSLPVNGTSMNPFLKNGDYVYLTKPLNIKKNDIILYKRNEDEFVLHRVVKVKNDYFVLMGDHQVIKEAPIYNSQVIAKVTKAKRNNNEYSFNKFKYKLYLFFMRFNLLRRLIIKFYDKKK